MQKFPKVFTIMSAILALAFGLASCKANVDDDPTMYTVTVSSSIEHGKVTADKSSAEAGASLKLTATADDGYELEAFSVKDASANELTVTDGTFTMPKSNVTVSATFKETAETVNKNAADAVIAKITAIGTVAYTAESKAKIDDARTAYDALTDAQKELVPEETLALLTAAETKYAELKAAAEQQNPSATTYTVAIASGIANRTVTASPTTAAAGTEITLTAEPASGYTFGSYSVTDADGAAVTVTDNKFTMPESNVTVSATFKATAVTPQKTAGSISYDTTNVEKTTAAEAFTNTLTNTGDGTVSYASSKTDVATVNATTGEVTIRGAGETTITATVADSESYTYAVKSASYTLTVTQAVTYIGTKAPSEAKAVGDIVFNDGSATPYSEDLTLTDDEKNAAIAVIFYVGTDCSNDSTSRTLGVGLAQNQSVLAWCLGSADACNVNITTIQESDKDGSDNLEQIEDFDGVNDTATEANYPAFYFAKNYASQTGSNVSGTDYADGWYLPAKAELQKIYDILSTVNKELAACGGTEFDSSGVYWSSSQYASDDNNKAYGLNFYGVYWNYYGKSYGKAVCAVRAFN